MAEVTLDVSVTLLSGSHGPDAADQLLAYEVARVSGVGPTEVRIARSCTHCGATTHGRPVVESAAATFVSLSRADGVVLVAVSSGAPVGVDVEPAEAGAFAGFADVALHPLETADGPESYSTLWVRKEALLKATGHGLRLDPRQIRISDGEDDPRLLEWPGETMPSVHLHDLELDGYAACVAVLSDEAPQVTVRQGDLAALAC